VYAPATPPQPSAVMATQGEIKLNQRLIRVGKWRPINGSNVAVIRDTR